MKMLKNITYILFFFIALTFLSCKTTKTGIGSQSKEAKELKQSGAKDINNSSVFIDANKQKILGNYDEAARLFDKCLKLNPDDDASMFELAKIYLMQNRRDEALELSEKAAEIDPDNIYYQLLYSNMLQSFERYNDAAKVYEQIVKSNPYNLEYYDRLALVYLYDGKLDDAIKVYDNLEEKIGITEEFSLKKQSIYLQEKKINKAIEEIEKLIGKFPEESKYYAILAEMCLDNGLEDKAMEAYQKIIEIDPDNPYIHFSLADYYKKNGDEIKAFEELKLGFANPNLDIDTKIQILITYYTVTEIYSDLKHQAFELSEILIDTHPDDPKTYSIYGDFLFRDNKFEEARDAFRKVISLDSSKYLVWEQLLFTESELNDTNALLNESIKIIELFPEQPLPYLFAGSAYYQKKNWDECAKVLDRGLFYIVDNSLMEVQFYTYLGDAYNQLKDNEKSDEFYEKALSLDPDNDYVLNNYAYYLSLRNEKLDKAAKMAKKSTELKPNSSANQDTYGWVLYKMGYYEEAKIWIEKAIENGAESNAVILEHYGDVLWQLGEKEEANEWWLKAKEAGKGSEFLDKKVEDKVMYE